MSTATAPATKPRKPIAVAVRNIHSLFNSLDPSPFREKDLNAEAEAFIVASAREFPPEAPLLLRIHLQEAPAPGEAEVVTQAVHNYFAYRARIAQLDFRRLMREGRVSLAIGLAFLFACLAVITYVLPADDHTFLSFLRESLYIAGWVAMWQPMQTYLYDWWPIRRRRRTFEKLSTVPVEVVADAEE
ncbi:MAG: hypothetical protein RBT71_04695 [Flavobacteriales bacterium]|jgi:hypothetical protein|nr:hypothetical protein [Flavobacteriales bacterium]